MHLRIGFLLLLLGSAVLQTLPTCTTDDISGDYTHCASLQSNRTLYYYYSPDCNAENAPPLPPPNEDLPCNIDCSPGEYLPLDSIECELCEPGSYSLGGGKRFHIWEDSFPSSGPIVFDTYCSHSTSLVPSDDFPNCTGWTLDGYSTSSGDLTGLDSVNSILEVSFYLIENGSVAFYYMCDVETEGDALAYVLDEEMPIPLPRTTEFSYYTIPNISPGTHKVRWIFYKNPQAGTGEDIARITDVEIFGISAADDINCTPCAPGYYQPNIGQSQCLKCAANTFAEDEGSAACLPCVNGYSYEGASSCLPFDNICTVEEDAIAYFSNCTETSEGMRRTKYWEWQVPLFCNPEGVSLPEPQDNQPCAPCPPGSYDSDGVCIFCNNGQYRNGDSCAICGEGTVAIPAVYYTEWDSWTAVFSTYCYGPCSGDGWQLYHDFVRATLSPGVQNDILLTATVQVGYGGGFSYDWSINGTMHNSYFKVTLNGKVLSQAYSGSGSDYFEIPQGLHDIGFWAHGDGVDVSHIDISSLIIYGVEDGGVTECTPCPAGYYQASPGQQYCSACPFGSYNPNEGSTHCNLCETNTYSSRAGQSECVPCPDGAHSAPGAGYCQNPSCTFISSDAEYVYNLSPYAGVPQYVDNVEANNGHFLISYCGLLYENDSECEDSFICETYDNFNPYAPGRDYLDWAHSIGFEENDDPTTGFSLKYNGGETTGCNGGVNRTATVKFNCASDNEEFTILSYSPTESSDCNAIFVQNSVYGCPVCNSKDFDKVKGDCENGKRVVQYVKKENARCNGVVKDSTESCDNPLTDNGLIVITVVATLIGVLLLFVAIVTFVVISYQKRKVKYSHLSEDNELNTFVLEDDEEAELVQPDDDDDL